MREAVTRRLEFYRGRMADSCFGQAVDGVLDVPGTYLSQAQLIYLHVYAPVLVAYVEWVLENALRAGKKRLYFLARDAYPMYETAKRICAERDYPIECRYLRVSRYSMRLPEYLFLGMNCVDRICVGGIDVTFEKLMRRAGLTCEEGLEIAEELGCEPQETLSYWAILKLKDRLKSNSRFLQYTYNHSKATFVNTIGYLEQEGLFEDVSYALVDSGWIGTMQQSIQNLLRTRQKGRTLEGYYFGLYEIPKGESMSRYHSFYFGPQNGIRRKVFFSNCLFETIFSHTEGMTLGYRKNGNRFIPVSSDVLNPNGEMLERNAEVLEAYLREYRKGREEAEDAGKLCEKLLSEAMSRPEKWEVEAYGSNLFCDDILEGAMQEVAARIDREEIRRQNLLYRIQVMLGLRKGHVKDSAWMEGSIVREEGNDAAALKSLVTYKCMIYLRKALKNFGRYR